MKRMLGSALALAALLGASSSSAADLVVSAAASLQNAFTEVAKGFEQANSGTRVLFNFGASGQLVQQISRGAPADVLATADLETMDRAQKQRLIVTDTRANFVSNSLVVIVPVDSTVQVKSLADLAGVERIGLGTPESVPAGRYAKEALELAAQWDKLKDRYVFGQNVRQVLDYVARGEVDAGLVYATDAAIMRGKVKVAMQAQVKQPILYPIAAVKGSGNERVARRFVTYVNSEPAQQVLEKFGFGKP